MIDNSGDEEKQNEGTQYFRGNGEKSSEGNRVISFICVILEEFKSRRIFMKKN
jgi:hypothetical protein